jgi:HlyD family secretion protein
MKRPLIFLVICAVVGVVGVAAYRHWRQARPTISYRTLPVKRGDIQSTITATGVIEPEDVIDVGAQVMGRIESRGRDPQDPEKFIDYMSHVEKGTVLAQIDASVYRAQVEQAKAAVAQAAANVDQQQVLLSKADRDWKRAQDLRKSGGISDADFDLYLSNYESGKAMLGVTRATLASAEAALSLAEINLGYTTIVSPVKGVIIDRRVNVGQTVVSSLTAPSLFLIAKDLTRLQVWASVNEADIGQIRIGQEVRFTVDAYPNEVFPGEVTQIRLNATMTQNVVTYTVVVSTDNTSGRLLPYLTANLSFGVASRTDVLLIPNPALRWHPHEATADKANLPPAETPGSGRGKSSNLARIWILENGEPHPLDVVTLLSDGTQTAVESDRLSLETQVIVGETSSSRNEANSSPFAPSMFRPGSGSSGAGGAAGRGGRP